MSSVDDFRAYVVYLRIEHRELHQVLLQVEALCADSRSEVSDCERTILAAMRQLRTRLAKHFAAEEEGGCIEEAVGHLPRLGKEADRIERDHPALLAELDDMIAQLELSAGDRRPTHTLRRFHEFAAKLVALETNENQLLEAAFGISVEVG